MLVPGSNNSRSEFLARIPDRNREPLDTVASRLPGGQGGSEARPPRHGTRLHRNVDISADDEVGPCSLCRQDSTR